MHHASLAGLGGNPGFSKTICGTSSLVELKALSELRWRQDLGSIAGSTLLRLGSMLLIVRQHDDVDNR